MAKIYLQSSPCVLDTSASIAASGSTTGSLHCAGYARVVGVAISSASLVAGSGIRVEHSCDLGSNWDGIEDLGTLTACSGSLFSACLVGNAVRVTIFNGATDADEVRAQFRLVPIW